MKSFFSSTITPQTTPYDLLRNGQPSTLWLLVGVILTVVLFIGGLAPMTDAWQTEEYSHAYLIPVIAILLFLQQVPNIAKQTPQHSIYGIYLVLFGIVCLAVGELSTIPTIIQYGFIVALSGLVITVLGTNGFITCWTAIAYLCFMIPLPTMIQNNLSHDLQLISSSIGVAIVRLFNISVFLEGNVIDLGKMKLQVVDACSGLRYLFPLMSFGFLIAALYRAPVWQKVAIFLSTIPITILMNSARIGLVGVTVEHFGIKAAEGFLHYFEGWFIFIFCLLILFLLIQLMRKLTSQNGSFIEQLNVSLPETAQLKSGLASIGNIGKPYVFSIITILLCLPAVVIYGTRSETIPARENFNSMPLVHKGWLGRESKLQQDVLDNLKLTDYFFADFQRDRLTPPVNLYIAYYDSQKSGAGIHSPKSCIPGGGWEIQSLTKHPIENVPLSSRTGNFIVNKVLIQKGEQKSVVYYWFEQRGRIINDEFLNRWYILVDSIAMNRSDGALVRVSIPLLKDATLDEVDLLAEEFIDDFYPMLIHYLPD